MFAPEPLAAVDARGLVKVFGVTPALVGVDLLMPVGTVCALFGGNGAGKTTLLRCVATALRPSAGTLYVMGIDAGRRGHEVRALTDLVPAVGGAYPDLSGRENLRFALAMRAVECREIDLEAAIEAAGLGDAFDDPVRTYSTGMVRRLALARILMTRPALLLLDEPYAALDDAGRALVDDILWTRRAAGLTSLLATHDRGRAAVIADVAVELEGGVIAGLAKLSASDSASAAAAVGAGGG